MTVYLFFLGGERLEKDLLCLFFNINDFNVNSLTKITVIFLYFMLKTP